MNVIIIGAVAAGTKVAAKLKRLDSELSIKILTKGEEISYAGCGLPYYISSEIEDRSELVVNTPEKFSLLTDVPVITGAEVMSVDTVHKTVHYRKGNQPFKESYDKLVIASGAESLIPEIEGVSLDGVFAIRSVEDADRIKEYIRKKNAQSAVVAGAGFIGIEMADALVKAGLKVTLIDMADQIMGKALDYEMAHYLRKQMEKSGVDVITSCSLEAVEGKDSVESVRTKKRQIKADLVVLALGVKPNTSFLEGSAIEMYKGAIAVNERMETSVDDVYAAGDCAVVKNRITGKPLYSAMGSTANMSARCLALSLTGYDASYPGAVASAVVKISDSLSCARTGLGEEEARECGFDVVSSLACLDDKAHYYPDSQNIIIKMIADKKSHRILGLQTIGGQAVAKIADIAVIAVSKAMRIEEFDYMDFTYAPPFSTAISPFVTMCYILENKIKGEIETISAAEYLKTGAKGYKVIDVLPEKSIPGAHWIDLLKVEKHLDGLKKDEKLLLVCNRGKRAYLLQKKLKALGYTQTKVLEGGVTFSDVKVDFSSDIPAEEIKRVKALGCLQDKRYPDVFNVRVITRNGKISSDEQISIAEAARRFGSGEVTMTTRLTLEIQGVPYSRLEETFAFLKERGLSTGGTGSKVRPVVSCKGTTCQYGLIDTFDLSEKLHRIFYEGWHDVALPHKFKIAVGGCPNNCVKPSLNDIGIIGQRVIDFDFDKCKGCKICQIEKACPIKIAHMENGRIVIKDDECNHCGRCLSKCPFAVASSFKTGYAVYVGGRWGKKVEMGKRLSRILYSEDEVISAVENAILLFRDEGISGERFADTVNRLTLKEVEKRIFSDNVDKTAILKKNVVGGATC